MKTKLFALFFLLMISGCKNTDEFLNDHQMAEFKSLPKEIYNNLSPEEQNKAYGLAMEAIKNLFNDEVFMKNLCKSKDVDECIKEMKILFNKKINFLENKDDYKKVFGGLAPGDLIATLAAFHTLSRVPEVSNESEEEKIKKGLERRNEFNKKFGLDGSFLEERFPKIQELVLAFMDS
jgi:hypothetical protein